MPHLVEHQCIPLTWNEMQLQTVSFTYLSSTASCHLFTQNHPTLPPTTPAHSFPNSLDYHISWREIPRIIRPQHVTGAKLMALPTEFQESSSPKCLFTHTRKEAAVTFEGPKLWVVPQVTTITVLDLRWEAPSPNSRVAPSPSPTPRGNTPRHLYI